MKILQLFTLFIFVNSFAQITTIEKLDGSIISATKAEYSFLTKKLTYWVGKDKEKVNYSDLKSVSNVNYIFRYFPQAKIFKGMFIKAETKDKVLAFFHYDENSNFTPTVSDGTGKPMYPLSVKGWTAKNHDIVHLTVFDKQGNVLDDVNLISGPAKINSEQRGDAFNLIKKHFSDCPALINEMDAFLKREEDPKNLLINFYFMQRDFDGYLYKYLECK